jgi:hypothetical protein
MNDRSREQWVAEPKQPDAVEGEDWTHLSQQVLEHAYAADEPDYSLDVIKESNPGTIAQWTYRQRVIGT